MRKKYVMIDECLPIIFPEGIEHIRFNSIGKITSAGFLFISFDELKDKFVVLAYGKSESLNLVPGEYDEVIIEDFLND